jgi:hypothetical protein
MTGGEVFFFWRKADLKPDVSRRERRNLKGLRWLCGGRIGKAATLLTALVHNADKNGHFKRAKKPSLGFRIRGIRKQNLQAAPAPTHS